MYMPLIIDRREYTYIYIYIRVKRMNKNAICDQLKTLNLFFGLQAMVFSSSGYFLNLHISIPWFGNTFYWYIIHACRDIVTPKNDISHINIHHALYMIASTCATFVPLLNSNHEDQQSAVAGGWLRAMWSVTCGSCTATWWSERCARQLTVVRWVGTSAVVASPQCCLAIASNRRCWRPRRTLGSNDPTRTRCWAGRSSAQCTLRTRPRSNPTDRRNAPTASCFRICPRSTCVAATVAVCRTASDDAVVVVVDAVLDGHRQNLVASIYR